MAWRAEAFAAALAAALSIAPAAAALPPPPPAAATTLEADRGLAAVAVPMRPALDGANPTDLLEGRVTERAWRLAAPEPTTLGAARAARAALEAEGFAAALDCGGEGCGGFDFRRALDAPPPPAMGLSLADFRALTMRRARDDGAADVVALLFSRVGPNLFGHARRIEGARPAPGTTAATAPHAARDAALPPPPPAAGQPSPADPRAVAVASSDPAPSPPDAGRPDAGRPDAGRPDAGRTDGGPPDAAALAAALDAGGRAALEGVDFRPGGTDLAPGAEAALDAAAALFAARPQLSAAVVGHTDDTGDLEANLRISRARAQAVVAALTARGVAAARLSAHGAGWLAPRASNADAQGRARNRRVELVAR